MSAAGAKAPAADKAPAGDAAAQAAAAAKPAPGAKPAGEKPAGGAQKPAIVEKKPVGSILDDSAEGARAAAGGEEDAGTEAGREAAATWPEDWREQMAGGDEKALALAKRYASPQSIITALKSLRSRLDAGEFKKGLGADATEDEIKQFRKDNGIPDKADGYELPDGLEIGEIDQPIVEGFLEMAHKGNYPPNQVKELVAWWYAAREEEAEQAHQNDERVKLANEDTLRSEWGPEFRGNINGIKNYLRASTPEGFADRLFSARMGNGILFGNDVQALNWLVGIVKEVNPSATITRPGGESGLKGVQDRIKEIETLMRTDRAKYDKDEGVQKEYLSLLRAKEKHEERSKAA